MKGPVLQVLGVHKECPKPRQCQSFGTRLVLKVHATLFLPSTTKVPIVFHSWLLTQYLPLIQHDFNESLLQTTRVCQTVLSNGLSWVTISSVPRSWLHASVAADREQRWAGGCHEKKCEFIMLIVFRCVFIVWASFWPHLTTMNIPWLTAMNISCDYHHTLVTVMGDPLDSAQDSNRLDAIATTRGEYLGPLQAWFEASEAAGHRKKLAATRHSGHPGLLLAPVALPWHFDIFWSWSSLWSSHRHCRKHIRNHMTVIMFIIILSALLAIHEFQDVPVSYFERLWVIHIYGHFFEK